jgi:hypothetical protein
MKKVDSSPAEFLDRVPDRVRADMKKLHTEIAKAMQGLPVSIWTGKMWGGTDQTIIGYGDMNYARPGGKTVEWFLIGLALQKNYISLYVNAVSDNKYLGQSYAKKLGKVKVGSASISFKQLSDVNLAELRDMLARARKISIAG